MFNFRNYKIVLLLLGYGVVCVTLSAYAQIGSIWRWRGGV